MYLAVITNASLIVDLFMGAWTTSPKPAVKTVKLEPKPCSAEKELQKKVDGLQSEKAVLEKKFGKAEKKTRSQEQVMKVLCKILVLEKEQRKSLQKEVQQSEKKVEASLEVIRKNRVEFEMAIEQERNNFEYFLEEFKQNVTAETDAIIEANEMEAGQIKSELQDLKNTVEKIKVENMILANMVQAHEEKSTDDTDMQWSRNLSEAAFYMAENTISTGNAFNYKGKQVWDKAVYL